MPDIHRYLAIDLGAESGRGIIVTLEGGKVSMEEIHRFPNRSVRLGGTLYWDFPAQFAEVLAVMQVAAERGEKLDAMAIDTWGVDFGLIAADGTLLSNPVHYRDSRTEGIHDHARDVMPIEEIFAVTALQPMPINTLFQLHAMQRANSPLLEMVETLLMVPDLFNYFLTGKRRCELTEAQTSQMIGTDRQWSDRVLEAFGLRREMFPALISPGTVLGELRGEIAELTGLSGVPVVACASHDTGSAVAAVPAEGDSWAYLSCGTWSIMGTPLEQPVATQACLEGGFSHELTYGSWYMARNILGLWLVQQLRARWNTPDDAWDYARMTDAAAEAAPGPLVDVDAPSLLAPDDMEAALVALLRESGQGEPENRGQLVRCVLESLALQYAVTLEAMNELTGRSPEAPPTPRAVHRRRRHPQPPALPVHRRRLRHPRSRRGRPVHRPGQRPRAGPRRRRPGEPRADPRGHAELHRDHHLPAAGPRRLVRQARAIRPPRRQEFPGLRDREDRSMSETKTVRWGTIGCGDVVERKSGPALIGVPGSELVAVMRRDPDKAADYARRNDIPRWYSSVEGLLGDEDVEAVYVATPNNTHLEPTLAALEAGKHVLVEKPMARNTAACQQMIDAAEQAGVILAVAYYRRGYPTILKAKELAESGAIGKVTGIQVNDEFPLSHRLDLVHFFCGDASRVWARREQAPARSHRPEGPVLHVQTVSGAEAVMNIEWEEHLTPETVLLIGETGRIDVSDIKGGHVSLIRGDQREEFPFEPLPAMHWGLVENFVAHYNGRAPLACDGVEGRKSTVILDIVQALKPDAEPVKVHY